MSQDPSLQAFGEPSARIRAATSLSISANQDGYTIYNFLTAHSVSANVRCLELLHYLQSERDISDIFIFFSEDYHKSLVDEIVTLLRLGIIMIVGDAVERRDASFATEWEWGSLSGALHFSTKDNQTVPDEEAVAIQVERASVNPSPQLWIEHSSRARVALPALDLSCELFGTMRDRRTVRAFQPRPISLQALSDVLFCGLGIVARLDTPAGELPLKMTPSPGARNPYEAYVFTKAVEGLEHNRFYHYSAITHSLEPIENQGDPPSAGRMFAENQPWVEGASAIVVLVAFFERVMWKYLDNNAYKAVLIEGGHVAQNMMLAATKHGIAANPAGAIAHGLIEAAIGLDEVTRSCVYALAMGHPDELHPSVAWLAPEFARREEVSRNFGRRSS